MGGNYPAGLIPPVRPIGASQKESQARQSSCRCSRSAPMGQKSGVADRVPNHVLQPNAEVSKSNPNLHPNHIKILFFSNLLVTHLQKTHFQIKQRSK